MSIIHNNVKLLFNRNINEKLLWDEYGAILTDSGQLFSIDRIIIGLLLAQHSIATKGPTVLHGIWTTIFLIN
jgi:hypothetical protein